MNQKLITIYLTDSGHKKPLEHGQVEEHLEQYLADGWRIVNLNALGGSAVEGGPHGWVVTVLEKEDRQDSPF